MFLVPCQNARINNVYSSPLRLVASDICYKQIIDSMTTIDSIRRSAVGLEVQFSWFSMQNQFHVFMVGSWGVECSISYDI